MMSVKQLTFLSVVLFTLGCSVSGHSDTDKSSKKVQSKETQTAQKEKASAGGNAKLEALLNRESPGSSSASGKAGAAAMASPALGGKKEGKVDSESSPVRSMAISADMLTPEVIAEMKKMVEEQKAAEAEGKDANDQSKDETTKK